MRGRLSLTGALLFGFVVQPVLALDCDPRGRDAMPCCKGSQASPSFQLAEGSLDCCRVSPVGPEGGRPVLRAPSPSPAALAAPVASPVTAAPARAFVLLDSADPADSPPPRRLVLRL
jgi:hypothetical protein